MFNKEIKKQILEVINNIAEDNKITAACVYGSRVAGYGREESDYDLIIVLKDYKPKVKYRYINEKLDISALIVNEKDLVNDAKKASLGEFVIGRLLNPYYPLIGDEFLREIETEYKTRIIEEILDEEFITYGKFFHNIHFPIKYFLFEKLKKRASMYPPAKYSYVKTYFGDFGEKNVNFTIKNFIEGAKILKNQNEIIFENNTIRIIDKWRHKKLNQKIVKFILNITRIIKSYLVHGYAARVGPNVFAREFKAKFDRNRSIIEIPDELKFPKKLLKIESGILIIETENWLYEIASYLGLKQFTIKQDRMGEFYNIANLYIIKDKNRTKKIVVKKFRDIRSLKWPILNIITRQYSKFEFSPISRLANEYKSINKLTELGINTLKIIGVYLSDRILVTEYIDGTKIDDIINQIFNGKIKYLDVIKVYGRELGKIHNSDYVLGDTKPSNAIWSKNKVYFTDLEHTKQYGNKAWDIGEFICFASKFSFNYDIIREIINKFIDGYLETGDKRDLKKLVNSNILKIFIPMLTVKTFNIIKNIVEKRVKNY